MLKRLIHACVLPPLIVCVRLLLALRYRIRVKGLSTVKAHPFDRSKGILFLPNHPAEMDPVILQMLLFGRFKTRPVIVEHFYHLKGFRVFMDLVGVLPLPTMDEKANKWRIKRVETQFQQLVRKVDAGENILIYPSGRLKKSALELIGGASLTHRLVQACAKPQVVLVRTTGLWGSQFSRALTHRSPDFGPVLWNCFKILLKNALFFAPRRDVLVEFELAGTDFPYKAPRLEFNKYLEQWYNRYPEVGAEPLKLVPFAFWSKALPVIAPERSEEHKTRKPVSSVIVQEVRTFLSQLSKRPMGTIEREGHLAQDLGLDSLDLVQVYLFLDEHYGRGDVEPGSLHTVEDVLQAASGNGREKEEEEIKELPAFTWPKETRSSPRVADGDTIQEVLLRSIDRGGGRIACVDALSGAMTYRQLKMRALLLAELIRPLPDSRVGILLPSSCAAYLVILAVLLAGKVPVMLNWTAGAKVLDYSLEATQFDRVITSMKFLDRLENEELGQIEERFWFLEDIVEQLSLKKKLKALWLHFKGASSLLRKLHLNKIAPSDPAVILFTSGTESVPKAVPLTHINILSNQRAAMQAATLYAEDILYGVLPPFHSFGFSVTGLLPLLTGLRVCYAPDPTDSHGLARDIARYRATMFLCAPSFIKALFRIAEPGQLDSLRLVVSGAEKTPRELFDYVREHLPHARLLEGYGITECSPIVSIDRENEPHKGVGKPIPGMELMIVDPETGSALPVGKEGEIYIAGPCVFPGYLGERVRSPFVTMYSQRWYASGDRGSLTHEGVLMLSGRAKRFVKVGGEMISLSALEEELHRLAQSQSWFSQGEGASIALSSKDREGDRPLLVLFTTFPVSLEDVNRGLKQSGFGKIVKIEQVRQMKEIPLMGTGKINYRLLDGLIGDDHYGKTQSYTV